MRPVPIELSETKTKSGRPVIRTNFITEEARCPLS